MGLFDDEEVAQLARAQISGTPVDMDFVQKALRESHEWWEVIFATAGIGILFGTLDGEILATSPKLLEMLGYTEEELTEVGIRGMTHPDDFQTDLELFGELVAGARDHYQLEKRYIRKDGSVLWGLLTVILLRDADGQPRFGIAMIEDLTQAKLAAEYEVKLKRAGEARRRALELNDNVLQQLVVAKLAFESGEIERASDSVESGLDALRSLIDSLLVESEGAGELEPGSFVRERRKVPRPKP